MIHVFIFMTVILSCLPLLHSATGSNTSMATCPKSFRCPALDTLRYPFYNVTNTRCGLIKVNCTPKGGEIQVGKITYEINRTLYFDNNSNLWIKNTTFEQLVKYNSCEALMNSFTFPSPSPLLYSILVFPNITLFKCTENIPYFEQHKYNNYNGCIDHNFYYNYVNGTVPGDLSHACQVVQLPVKQTGFQDLDETNIFSLLSPGTFIHFSLSDSCIKCQDNGQSCGTENGDVQCLEVKWEARSREPMQQGNQSRGRLIMILVIVGSALILMMSFVIFIIWRCRSNNPFSYVSSKKTYQDLEDISLSFGISVFTYKELVDATQNFDPCHELGDGGFGAVYYGKLKDGREVAVKKLHEHNYNRVQHFRNEVEILAKLRHKNLVFLYGFTSRLSRELLLVYEYVPNGTVADHLHGKQANENLLTWPIRMNIAIETAKAIVYLHACEIIHRDVKTTNILLDNNFCVKVADFGLSRHISDNFTHVSTAPQGTPGYVDPQYHQHYQLTDKSDIYSFGVVLIELISSMEAVDLERSKEEISLANMALNKIQRCAVNELIDPVLGFDKNPEILNTITLVAELAFRCLQYDSDIRPTINEVLDVLIDIQAVGRIDAYNSTRDLQTVIVQPLSETNDDFVRSPVSVTSEWQSNNSETTMLSSNGDRLSMKNDINMENFRRTC